MREYKIIFRIRRRSVHRPACRMCSNGCGRYFPRNLKCLPAAPWPIPWTDRTSQECGLSAAQKPGKPKQAGMVSGRQPTRPPALQKNEFGADFSGFLVDRGKPETLYTALTTGGPPSLQGAKARLRSISLFIVKAASEVDRKPFASTALMKAFWFAGKRRSQDLRAV